jgi:mono/diheme cytochrome c family protein
MNARESLTIKLMGGLVLAALAPLQAAEISPGLDGFKSGIVPFFKEHCITCHGPDKSKGKITVHTLNGDLTAGHDLEHWELILEMLESGEMPPEDEPQPAPADRRAVAQWIEAGLRDYVASASSESAAPTTRRLTNIEYENTIRDLVGIDLDLLKYLPEDPTKPYTFNNTAEFMMLGPEQIQRYRENARRVMAAVIVDPEPPKVHTHRTEWQPHGNYSGMGRDEIGVWQGGGRYSPGGGWGITEFPEHGQFRIRVQASAILPPGIPAVPLRLIMGHTIAINSSNQQVEPVGEAVELSNNPDSPRVVEFTGRIENYPIARGVTHRQRILPDTLTITPQNLYDDGSLNVGGRDLEMPRIVINWMEFEGPVFDAWPPKHHTDILFESPLRESDPEAYLASVLQAFASRAFRRPAESDEVQRYISIFKIVESSGASFEEAIRETLAMMLISPQFLYHTEENEKSSGQYELASRLSYFLWASMPDEELISLAGQGRLDEPGVIQAQVLRMLDDKRAEQFVRTFTLQWMSLAKSLTVPINKDLFPSFLYYVPAGERAGTEMPYRPTIRDYMIDETVGFIGELIKRNDPVLDIVDSDFAYINQPLAAHYGIEGVHGNTLRPVPITAEQRLGGLLTQGSVLIGNGTGSAPHPIYRAVWLREAILGDEVAPPPAEVPALSDSAGDSAEKALTIKDLLAKHRQQESCNDCHVRLDPWGIPFERYNAIGRYQAKVPKEGTRVQAFNPNIHTNMVGYTEYLDRINTEAIEAEARVPHGPMVDGMDDLKNHLLKRRKDDIVENVVRRLLTYSLGRELTYHDRFAVESLVKEARTEKQGFRDIIISICQSDLFTGKG